MTTAVQYLLFQMSKHINGGKVYKNRWRASCSNEEPLLKFLLKAEENVSQTSHFVSEFLQLL